MVGRELAHFKVTAKLGEGGMGEVYRATDTQLGREVALKVLPEAVSQDDERLARFEREAKVLASLNHSGIAAIHSLEKADGVRFLIMELVPGEPLDDRLRNGPFSVEEAVEIARQMAVGLETAHEQGIIHRDLKPANVMLTPDGDVKILDFGLAKAAEAGSGNSPHLTQSPTITHQMTRAGVLLGTAAYMSPEQARGQEADKRSDVWSFGVVLYEMLTGRNSFGGDTISDTLAAVLRAEPDLDELPATVPPALRRLVARCLEKDPRQRLRDIGEARILLEGDLESETTAAVSPVARPPRRRALPWAIAALAILTLGLLGWKAMSSIPAAEARYLSVSVPPGLELGSSIGIGTLDVSRDGKLLAFVGKNAGRTELYVRDLTTGETRLLEGTEDADAPFFSHDGRWIGFQARSKLRKVSVAGGAPVEIADAYYSTGSWGEDGTIVFHQRFNVGLSRVSATGGPVETLTEPAEGELGHFFPQILPDGKHVLYTAVIPPVDESKLMLLSLEDNSQRLLRENASHGRVTANGFLVYAYKRSLWAVRWDDDRLAAPGPAVRIHEDFVLDEETGGSDYAVSTNGLLVYVPWSLYQAERELLSLDRTGRPTPLLAERGRWTTPALSPDGRRISLALLTESSDIWVYDLDRGTRSRLTSDPRTEWAALWRTNDELVFTQDVPPYDLYEIRADGSGRRLLFADDGDKTFDAVSPDGSLLAFSRLAEKDTGGDIWFLEYSETEPSVRPFFEAPSDQDSAAFSPDGQFVAYQSDESGRWQIYVRPLDGGTRVQVSIDGGISPLWRRNEIFYRHENQFLAAKVDTRSGIEVDEPEILFEGNFETSGNAKAFDVSRDGQQIIVLRTPPEFLPTRAHVVLNWFQELERKYGEGSP